MTFYIGKQLSVAWFNHCRKVTDTVKSGFFFKVAKSSTKSIIHVVYCFLCCFVKKSKFDTHTHLNERVGRALTDFIFLPNS